MPELPDVTVYCERIESMLRGVVLTELRLRSSFLLRSVEPSPSALHGQSLVLVRRLGKRLVFQFSGDLYLVLHLMIAGRLHWFPREKKLGSKIDLCAFDFTTGSLVLTEAGQQDVAFGKFGHPRHRVCSLSKLNRAAHSLAVYARLATGPLVSLWPGGIDPLGWSRKFQSSVILSSSCAKLPGAPEFPD